MTEEDQLARLYSEFKVPTDLQERDHDTHKIIVEHLFTKYLELDADAIDAQDNYLSSLRTQFGLLGAAGACSIFIPTLKLTCHLCHCAEHLLHKACLAFEGVALLAAGVIAWQFFEKELLQIWLTKRQCAEVMRSKIYFALARLPIEGEQRAIGTADVSKCWDMVKQAFSSYRAQFTDGSIKANAKAQETDPDAIKKDVQVRCKFLRDGWVNDQHKYHVRRAKKFHKKHMTFEVISGAIFGATLLLVGGLFLDWHCNSEQKEFMEVLKYVLPAVALALLGYSRTRQFGLEARRSERAAEDLKELEYELHPDIEEKQLKDLAERIEAVMLGELRQWHTVASSSQSVVPG